jgi:hypothetical protein
LQRTLYLDESGDLGFAPASTQYLVVAFLSVPRKHDLLRAMRWVKQRLEIPASEELKGTLLAWPQRRQVLEAVAALELSIHAIIVRKAGVRPHLRANPNVLYNYALQFPLVDHIRGEGVTEVSLVIDQRTQKVLGPGQELDHYLSVKLIAEAELDVAFRCHHVGSHNSLGIQAADVVVNAIGRKYERGQAWGYNVISPRIADERRLYFGEEH